MHNNAKALHRMFDKTSRLQYESSRKPQDPRLTDFSYLEAHNMATLARSVINFTGVHVDIFHQIRSKNWI